MIVGRPQQDDIRALHPRLEFGITGQLAGGVRVVKRQRLTEEIKHINRAAGSLKLLLHMTNNDARHRVTLQAADDCQDV